MSLKDFLKKIEERIIGCEEKTADQVYSLTGFMDSVFKRRDKRDLHRTTEFSVYKAWCVSTLDPRRQNRVKFFCPYLHEPNTQVKDLPYASPVSPLPGIDDSGCVWTPPAGSTIIIIFEAGYTHNAYYLGSIWPRYRGPEGHPGWDQMVALQEYQDIHSGHRKGYIIGMDDESQILPPWNTENYNAVDLDSATTVFDVTPQGSDSYPHIMGFKSSQKHMMKWDDGDYRCNYRWKRMEIMSSLGHWLCFKDDHLHEGGQWANPSCNVHCGTGNNLDCVDDEGNPISVSDCSFEKGIARNQYFKHQNECRPYIGPQTPQNNRCNLPQAGIQILSISGHTMIFDDSVEQPQGIPEWERVLKRFDFGCTDVYTGRMVFKSATGQRIELNDEESDTNIRGRSDSLSRHSTVDACDEFDPWNNTILDRKKNNDRPARNGILLLSATGNRVELNDETTAGGVGGPNRGITLQTSSNHVLEMLDHLNTNSIKDRMEGGAPEAKAKDAVIRLRSGYGLLLEMRDAYSQQSTQQQYIQLTAPQKDACCGPHYIRMQEDPSCGFILVRAGGDYVRSTDRHELITVGPGCYGPSDRFLSISHNYIVDVTNMYFNQAHSHIFDSETYIALIAGRDCPSLAGPNTSPCIYRVATDKCASYCPLVSSKICLSPKSFSNRVFVSNDNSSC